MAETVVPALSPPMLLPLASALLIEERTNTGIITNSWDPRQQTKPPAVS